MHRACRGPLPRWRGRWRGRCPGRRGTSPLCDAAAAGMPPADPPRQSSTSAPASPSPADTMRSPPQNDFEGRVSPHSTFSAQDLPARAKQMFQWWVLILVRAGLYARYQGKCPEVQPPQGHKTQVDWHCREQWGRTRLWMRVSVAVTKGAAGSSRTGCTCAQPLSSCRSSRTQLVYSVRKLCTQHQSTLSTPRHALFSLPVKLQQPWHCAMKQNGMAGCCIVSALNSLN